MFIHNIFYCGFLFLPEYLKKNLNKITLLHKFNIPWTLEYFLLFFI